MLKNYFKTAWRNLVRNKLYTTINMTGLAFGLATGILIILWVTHELSYDKFHQDGRNIYRVLSNMGSGSERQIWSNSHAPMATFAKKEIPEIKNAVRLLDNRDFSVYKYKNKQFRDEKKAYVDSSFFAVFDFELLMGDPENPFHGDHSVILTLSSARRYFNHEYPIGKILLGENNAQFLVTGVLEDFPQNSSITYDMLFPMSLYANTYARSKQGRTIDEDWGNFSYHTFVQLHPEAAIPTVTHKLSQMLRKNFRDIGIDDPYSLQPLTDMHLYKTDGTEGVMQTVRIFMIVGGLILIIACINYVNLSTAHALVRAKEVSVRKIIGAGKVQLFIQFMIETALVFLLATVAALILARLLMPVYNHIAGKNMNFSLTDPNIWKVICSTVVGTLALSSIYPALFLSSFEPLKGLKGKISIGMNALSFRKILVTVQFVFSAALITGTLIIDRQLDFILKKELGYNKEYVFTFGVRDLLPHAESVKAELLKQQGVLGVAYANDQIVNLGVNTSKTDWDGKDPDHRFFIHPIAVDEDFLSIFRMELTVGHGFTGTVTDSANYILNETAVKEAGIIDPIGKRFSLWGNEGTIIGVVKDFHFASLKQKIQPAIFHYEKANSEMYIKTTSEDASRAIAATEKTWKQYNATLPFEYTFLDETFDNLYKSEQRTGVLFKGFSIIAVLISCLGLLGLTTHTTHVKTKEIGIRKVMGAGIADIIHLLAKDFIRLALVANVVAAPLAWYGMSKWLQDYAYRVEIRWWMFVLVGLLSLTIAIVTISFQSIKAALKNPVKSLRSE